MQSISMAMQPVAAQLTLSEKKPVLNHTAQALRHDASAASFSRTKEENPHIVGRLRLVGSDMRVVALAQQGISHAISSVENEWQLVHRTEAGTHWEQLQEACIQSRTQLEASLESLEHSALKKRLLKEEWGAIHSLVRAGLDQVNTVYKAAQAVQANPASFNLYQLKQALQALEKVRKAAAQPAVQQHASWITRFFRKVEYWLTPASSAGWRYIMMYCPVAGEFASSFIKFTGGTFAQAKNEDKIQLIKICQELNVLFKKIDKRLEMQGVKDAVRDNTEATTMAANYANTAASQSKEAVSYARETADGMRAANQRIDALEQKLEEKFTQIISLLQEKPLATTNAHNAAMNDKA